MTAMPIAQTILSTKKVNYTTPLAVDPNFIGQRIIEATYFDVQPASDLYWLGSQNDYWLSADFGPLRLPFPTVWMEWAVPSRVLIRGQWTDNPPTRVGCLLMEYPLDSGDGYVIGSVSALAGFGPNATGFLSPLFLHFRVDEDGRYADTNDGVRFRFNEDAMDRLAANRRYQDDLSHLLVACLALNLINCKNVTTEVTGSVPVRRSGAQKRRKEPRIEYRTIRLPGSPSGGEATGENEGIMPLHRVRGHFKTFTPEAPLLGKCTGTYWWGWQVRGKKSNGEIIADYLLRESV